MFSSNISISLQSGLKATLSMGLIFLLNGWEIFYWLKMLNHQKRRWVLRRALIHSPSVNISFIFLNANFFFLDTFSQLTPIEKYALNYLELFHVSVDENEPRLSEVKQQIFLFYVVLSQYVQAGLYFWCGIFSSDVEYIVGASVIFSCCTL